MTGFGGASVRRNGFVITSEIKTVNNRYFKAALKISDGFSSLEPKIESFLRGFIDRGTVNVLLRIRREATENRYQINRSVLDYFLTEAKVILGTDSGHGAVPGTMVDFFRLPGVIEDASFDEDSAETVWESVEENLKSALAALDEMRSREGEIMGQNLRSLAAELIERIDEIAGRAPGVVARYRERLTDRIASVMTEHRLELNDADLVREIALFTDKADISEEIVRFRSHLDQFDAAMKMTVPCGKRLDFLTQEMFREVNTIGSKANSPEITHLVVDMKTIIERIREMVQNVE